MELLITLCGRGGSKGIPGKNIRMLNGKPLIAYSLESAATFAKEFNADISISSDSEAIIDTAAKLGYATAYRRPAELATDSAGKIDTIKDLLLYEEKKRNKKYDYILDLDITSPLRTLADLKSGFETLQQDENAYNLFSVNKANRNPYFNMVEQQENGYYNLVKTPGSLMLSRQAAPKVYDMNASFYFYRRHFFDSGIRSAITERSLIYLMPHTCFDLDEPLDFEFLEYLLSQEKLDFSI